MLTSMDFQIPLGRLHRRPIQLIFRDCSHWRKRSLSQLIPLVPHDQLVLSWWSNVMIGQSLVPFMSDMTILTDASLEGWEAHSDSATASGRWLLQWRSFVINWLELKAMKLALVAFQSQVENKHVMVMCDNKMAVTYINKQGSTRLKRLFLLAKSILLW